MPQWICKGSAEFCISKFHHAIVNLAFMQRAFQGNVLELLLKGCVDCSIRSAQNICSKTDIVFKLLLVAFYTRLTYGIVQPYKYEL